MAETSPLRRRMIEDMTIRNLSPATQQSYLYAVSKFSLYFGRSPDRLGVEDIRAYLVHLTAKGFAWSSVNQVGCALRFFYGVTLGQAAFVEKIPHAREPCKLPTVLSADEVAKFLEAVSGLKARVPSRYASGPGMQIGRGMIFTKRHLIYHQPRSVRQVAALLRHLATAWLSQRRALPQRGCSNGLIPAPLTVELDRSRGFETLLATALFLDKEELG